MQVQTDKETRQLFLSDLNNRDMLAKLIDQTLLKTDATHENFFELFSKANQYLFKSVCVPPSYVKLAKQYCKNVLVCTVIGFPNGYSTTETKIFETKDALNNGADEVDFVHNVLFVKSKEWDSLLKEYTDIVKAACGNVTKLILETSLLDSDEIVRCIKIAADAGVHMIKTSTGFGKRGASIQDIENIQQTLIQINKENSVGIKASGGVKNFEDALKMIKAGATRIGTSNGVHILKEAREKILHAG